jgi:hypothetical protein
MERSSSGTYDRVLFHPQLTPSHQLLETLSACIYEIKKSITVLVYHILGLLPTLNKGKAG